MKGRNEQTLLSSLLKRTDAFAMIQEMFFSCIIMMEA
jgi:hypothetical protein